MDHAISVIEKLFSLFIVGSEGYNRLNIFLHTLKIANIFKFEDADLDNRYYSFYYLFLTLIYLIKFLLFTL